MNNENKKKNEGQNDKIDKQKKIKQSFDNLIKQNGNALKRLSKN